MVQDVGRPAAAVEQAHSSRQIRSSRRDDAIHDAYGKHKHNPV
jgi:hypothetical protein